MSRSWRGRPCLVTGGAGFGGSHLCERLLERGAEVSVLDLAKGDRGYFGASGLMRRVRYVRGDVRDLRLLRRLLRARRIRTLFHLAAQPIVPLSNELPYETLHNNAVGAYAALEAVRTAAPRCGFVFASSGAYYGTTTRARAIREDEPPAPAAHIYAPSKVAGDSAVRSYARTFGLRAVCCRFMNTYGPGDPNLSRIVPRAVRNLLIGAPYDFGTRDDGATRLDYLHVRDMAEAYIAAAEHTREESGEAFNFGGGRPVSTRALARLISRLFDGKAREPRFRGRRRGRPLIKVLDTRKARRRLGWRPSIRLEDGLRGTIEWHRTFGRRTWARS